MTSARGGFIVNDNDRSEVGLATTGVRVKNKSECLHAEIITLACSRVNRTDDEGIIPNRAR